MPPVRRACSSFLLTISAWKRACVAVGRPRLHLRHQPSVRLVSDYGDASEQTGWGHTAHACSNPRSWAATPMFVQFASGTSTAYRDTCEMAARE